MPEGSVPDALTANVAAAPPVWATLGDEQLLRAMAAGHAGAFDALFARHSAAVLSFIARLTTARGDPEDLLQETFLRVLTHAQDFRPGAAFRPWLFTIARNVSYNWLQKRKLRSEVEVATDFATVVPRSTVSTSADPSSRMQSQEQRERVLAALETLPPQQREVIILVIFNSFSYEEAAQITGDPEGTLRSRVFHALRRLRERLM